MGAPVGFGADPELNRTSRIAVKDLQRDVASQSSPSADYDTGSDMTRVGGDKFLDSCSTPDSREEIDRRDAQATEEEAKLDMTVCGHTRRHWRIS